MNPSDRKTEVLVGLFVFCGLLLLGGLVLQFSNIREALRKHYTVHVIFRDSGGLVKASPVRYSGTNVGRVASLTPQVDEVDGIKLTVGVVAHLRINEDTNIPRGATITVGKEGLLGDAYVDIKPPLSPIVGVLGEGDTIAGRTGGGLADIQEAANEISQKTQIVLEDIRKGLLDVKNAIKKIDEGILSADNIEHFRKTMASLNSATEKFDARILDDENTANFKRSLANLSTASDELARQSGKLDGILTQGDSAMKKFGEAADSFKQGGREFTSAAQKAGRTAGEVNSGAGLMSALIHDPELRSDFKNLISNLKERGILFYKDKSEAPDRRAPARRRTPPAPGGPRR